MNIDDEGTPGEPGGVTEGVTGGGDLSTGGGRPGAAGTLY